MKKTLLAITLLCAGTQLSTGLLAKKGIPSKIPSDMQTRPKGKTKPAMEPVQKDKRDSQQYYDE